MTSIRIDKLIFEFPDDCTVSKFDDWDFYTKQFQSTLGGGVKAVDLIAIDKRGTAWFIEVKDYRAHLRTKPSCIAEETAEKIFDTFAALLPAKLNGKVLSEVLFVESLHRVTALKAVLHLEQPTPSTLFPVPISPVNVQMKLRRLLRAIDLQPVVCDMSSATNHGWRVRSA